MIAEGSRVVVKINDQLTADYVDPERRFLKGHIALQQLLPDTRVEFRKIEIKELGRGHSSINPVADWSSSRRPADAQVFQGKFYKVVTEQVTWHEARVRCQQMGGHLAIVTSEEQNRFLTNLVKRQGLGGAGSEPQTSRSRANGSGSTVRSLRFSNWDVPQHQPNNKQGIEHYMVLLTRFNGTWCDQPNDGRQEHPGFVCQWD